MGFHPKIIVFDSGLGGLTVYGELKANLPDAQYLYVADNDAFPYGGLQEEELVTRLLVLFDRLISVEQPDICVIACNTASTIALAPLREHFDVPFVGVVPAIKTAAENTQSGLFSLLATPGTVQRQYTRDLVAQYAGHCDVTLVGAHHLAGIAEQFMRDIEIDEQALLREIEGAFVEKEGQRTDIVILGCTHFPLLRQKMKKISPWEVSFIDPSPAIARQTGVVLSHMSNRPNSPSMAPSGRLIYTGDDALAENVAKFLRKLGLADVYRDEIIG